MVNSYQKTHNFIAKNGNSKVLADKTPVTFELLNLPSHLLGTFFIIANAANQYALRGESKILLKFNALACSRI